MVKASIVPCATPMVIGSAGATSPLFSAGVAVIVATGGTGVVELDVHDGAGALVAASTQQVTFLGPPPEPSSDMAARHAAFQSMFDGRCHLTEPLGLTQPTVSHHMRVLLDAGLVEREQRGSWAFFRVVPEQLGSLRALLA